MTKANLTWLFPVPQPHPVLDMHPLLFLLDEGQEMALGLTLSASPGLTDIPSGQIRETSGIRISSSALKSVALMKDIEGDVF